VYPLKEYLQHIQLEPISGATRGGSTISWGKHDLKIAYAVRTYVRVPKPKFIMSTKESE